MSLAGESVQCLGGERGVRCPVFCQAIDHPGRTAVQCGERGYSYLEFDNIIRVKEGYLRGYGIKGGQRIGVMGRHSVSYISLLFAIWRLGMVVVPLDFRFPLSMVREILRRLDIGFLVVDAWLLSEFQLLSNHGIRVLTFGDLGGGESSDDKVQGEEQMERGPVFIAWEKPATIILTSGSMGDSKGVLHTFANHYYNALGSNENISLGVGDGWLLSLPLFHVGGLGIVFRCFLAGAVVVVPLEEESLEQVFARGMVTHLSLVVTQLVRLLKGFRESEFDQDGRRGVLSRLKAVLLGGSGFSWSVIEQAVEVGLPVFTTYGLSEMGSQVTTTPPGAGSVVLSTSGKLLGYRELKIAEDGEICVRGLTLFRGYVEESGIFLPIDEGGWFHTRDLGRWDEGGNLQVLGRKDNMFISGGENIMPGEIERLLEKYPGVERVVVVPVEDEEYGFRPVVFIKLFPGVEIRIEEVFEYLQVYLPRFKIPRKYYSWPEEEGWQGLKIKRSYFQGLLKRGEVRLMAGFI